MSERLKQLLGQAYDEAVPETWTTLSSEQQERIYEKFAELIVRECTAVSRKSSKRIDDMGSLIAQDIEKHFGVE